MSRIGKPLHGEPLADLVEASDGRRRDPLAAGEGGAARGGAAAAGAGARWRRASRSCRAS